MDGYARYLVPHNSSRHDQLTEKNASWVITLTATVRCIDVHMQRKLKKCLAEPSSD